MRQKFTLLITGLITLMLFALFAPATPAQAASNAAPLACNPCDCANDNRENCQGIEFYAMYARENNGECTYDFYRFNGQGAGYRVMRVRESEIEALPANNGRNLLLRAREGIAMYRLGSGEYQVSAGPDQNGKVYYVVFNLGCPTEVIQEGSWQ